MWTATGASTGRSRHNTRMQPFFGSARYVNYLDADDMGEPIAAAYGANYPRLQRTKSKYDPKNLFRMNQNIRPSS